MHEYSKISSEILAHLCFVPENNGTAILNQFISVVYIHTCECMTLMIVCVCVCIDTSTYGVCACVCCRKHVNYGSVLFNLKRLSLYMP